MGPGGRWLGLEAVADARLRRAAATSAAAHPLEQPLQVPVADGVQLGNSGGVITLLDAAGLKVSGVSYTKEQARREGWTIAF